MQLLMLEILVRAPDIDTNVTCHQSNHGKDHGQLVVNRRTWLDLRIVYVIIALQKRGARVTVSSVIDRRLLISSLSQFQLLFYPFKPNISHN